VFAVYDELRMNAKKAGSIERAYCSLTLPKDERKRLSVAMGQGDSEWTCLDIAPGFRVWTISQDEATRWPKGFCSFGDNYDKLMTWLRWDRATGQWLGKFTFEGGYEPLPGGYAQALQTAKDFFTAWSKW
jgi:hypothetical protein